LETSLETEDNHAIKNEGSIYLYKITEDFNLYPSPFCPFMFFKLTGRARASFRKLLLQASKRLQQTRHAQIQASLFAKPVTPNSTTPSATPPPTSNLRHRLNNASPLQNQQDNSLLSTASDVTTALKRTHALLEQELEKSSFSLETLDHSTQTLRQLENQFSVFGTVLAGSKRLIGELERADKWDRWSIYGGLAVFGATCSWIAYKRLLRGPLGLIIWMFTKMMSVGKGGSTAVGSGLSSVKMSEVPTIGGISVDTRVEMGMTGDVVTETVFVAPMESGEPLWSEGIEPDDVVEYVTVTVEVDDHDEAEETEIAA